jgi:hypothetical protein
VGFGIDIWAARRAVLGWREGDSAGRTVFLERSSPDKLGPSRIGSLDASVFCAEIILWRVLGVVKVNGSAGCWRESLRGGGATKALFRVLAIVAALYCAVFRRAERPRKGSLVALGR